jgi:effector-binding domain-containing protein
MIRIGDFSRLARVSIRALRHYEDEGLLRPVHVDARNGYRYYDAAQLAALHRIKALRDLGVPVARSASSRRATIAPWAICWHTRAFAKFGGRGQRSVAPAGSAAAEGRDARRVSGVAGGVRAPAMTALRARRVDSLGTPVTVMFESAERAAARDRVDESPFLLFHDESYSDTDSDVEVCIPVAPQSSLPDVRVVGAVDEAACVAYGGPYSQTEPLYREVLSWLESTGASIAGPLREVYHRFGADQRGYRLSSQRIADNEADFITELQVPVARRSE